jgi:hypothetical protein
MKPLFLPLFLLFIVSVSCKEIDEPNVDLRIFYSVGDCMPVTPPYPERSSTPFTGTLKLVKDRICAGGCNDPVTSLRVYRGVLRMTLEPADYALIMDEPHVAINRFTVAADSVSAGAIYFRKCTSY